ncbi:FAD-dependent monooxygenase [Pseudenhygromyxa sp. WMMC2535]|uniref:FAD-dependent oxidoreductase n=1 Tax=Pseudenhygromyxa sp. WMMC2535 TaxID=2712867 RepID=UPI001552CD69|nr:FAD-dependent monooxygenase [Pseudenhygromyxa sp. WMMC2535]NVB37630.1 FAD-dependent monooxygenase [Pseudenhygromyxa sp. WMMC2535]
MGTLDRVIIIGGSVTGLSLAAALHPHARRVTVLERDEAPNEDGLRKGLPQASHIHLLLRAGANALESLVPGFRAALEHAGARKVDMAADFRWHTTGGWRPRFDSGLSLLMQSRALLDRVLIEQIGLLDGVDIAYGSAVEAPILDPGTRRVTGVRLANGERLDADLVLDASGRGSRAPRWCREWGFSEPPTQKIKINLSYVSAQLRFDPEQTPKVDALLVHPSPPSLPRGGSLFHLEGERWMSTFFGYHGDHPPTDFEAWRAWSKGLANSAVYDALAHAEPASELKAFKVPYQVRRCYAGHVPQRFAVAGDASCGFDPVFGQGMTVAALQALALHEHLSEGGDVDAIQRLFTDTSKVSWLMASTEAQRWPEVDGYRPPLVRPLLWLIDQLYLGGAKDRALHQQFLQVMNMEAPLTSLLAPRTLPRVVRGMLTS